MSDTPNDLTTRAAIDLWLQGPAKWNQWVKDHPLDVVYFTRVDFRQYQAQWLSNNAPKDFQHCPIKNGNIWPRFPFGHYHFPVLVEFTQAQFGDEASFFSATFDGGAIFRKAVFTGKADFYNAKFIGEADFGLARWDAEVKFSGTQFDRLASFGGAKFAAEARFNQARFIGGANFEGATFMGPVTTFSLATFDPSPVDNATAEMLEANFNGVRFHGDVRFERATFNHGDVTFHWAEFEKGADFQRGTFGGSANFLHVTFGGRAVFSYATFTKENKYRFIDCDFQGQALFSALTVDEAVDALSFEGSAFARGLVLSAAKPPLRLTACVLDLRRTASPYPLTFEDLEIAYRDWPKWTLWWQRQSMWWW
ncbi:MAG TPA: hypothetical protein DCS49_03335, partial [Gammaproteobacteria bacterium]|nr:hypothetical protein [Gammaproteobacteria bacterium]